VDIIPGTIVRIEGEVIAMRPLAAGIFGCQVRTPEGDLWLRSNSLTVVESTPAARPAPKRAKKEAAPTEKAEIPPDGPPADPSESDDPDAPTGASVASGEVEPPAAPTDGTGEV